LLQGDDLTALGTWISRFSVIIYTFVFVVFFRCCDVCLHYWN